MKPNICQIYGITFLMETLQAAMFIDTFFERVRPIDQASNSQLANQHFNKEHVKSS